MKPWAGEAKHDPSFLPAKSIYNSAIFQFTFRYGTLMKNCLRYWPFAIPILYFIVICALQPAGRLIPPMGNVPEYPLRGGFARVVFDDVDIAAWVLRAENAERGRKAGLKEEPGMYYPRSFALRLYQNPKLEERYFLEYPPAALYFFRLGLIGSGRPSNDQPISAAILDANQFNLAHFDPKNPTTRDTITPDFDSLPDITVVDAKGNAVDTALPIPPEAIKIHEQLWRSWRAAQRVYSFILLAVLLGLMLLYVRGVGANGIATGPAWLCILPGMLYFTPCRFDILPAAFSVFAIAFAARNRLILSALTLALAVAFKTYPLVLAPLLLRYSARSWKDPFVWCVAFALPLLAFNIQLMASDGIEAIVEPLKFQLGRAVEPWWIFFGRVFPGFLDSDHIAARLFRVGVVLGTVLCMCIFRPQNVTSLLRRCAIAVMVFISFQTFYSPQWWLWVAVLLIPLVRTNRWILPIYVVLDLITHAAYPWIFDFAMTKIVSNEIVNSLSNAFVFMRAGGWFIIIVIFTRDEFREARERATAVDIKP